jgi:hypothetical protein
MWFALKGIDPKKQIGKQKTSVQYESRKGFPIQIFSAYPSPWMQDYLSTYVRA